MSEFEIRTRGEGATPDICCCFSHYRASVTLVRNDFAFKLFAIISLVICLGILLVFLYDYKKAVIFITAFFLWRFIYKKVLAFWFYLFL